jgi:hypothetical protein
MKGYQQGDETDGVFPNVEEGFVLTGKNGYGHVLE